MNKEPKITIILTFKNGRKNRLSTFPSKIKNFGNLSLVKKAKLGQFKALRIKFLYGRDREGEIVNEMDCKDYGDLYWAFKAFSDKDLWV